MNNLRQASLAKVTHQLALSIEPDLIAYLATSDKTDRQQRLENATHLELSTLMAISRIAKGSHEITPSQPAFNSVVNQLSDALQDHPEEKRYLHIKLMATNWQAIEAQLQNKAITFTKNITPEHKRTEFIHSLHIPGLQENEQQEMISYIARQNPTDSMNISGYAGVGKTTMIQRLAGEFNTKRTVVLTKTKWQWQALRQKTPENVKVLTIDKLCDFILQNNNAESLWGNRYKRPYNFNHYINALQLTPMNGLSQEQVASIIGQQVVNFCESAHARIETHHFPVDLLLNYGAFSIDDIHAFPVTIYTQLARELWQRIMEKTGAGNLAITPQHALKFMDLTQTPLPGWIETLIIDESHDLSPVFANLLKRSKQVVISLGDEYQITDTKPRLSLQQEKVRRTCISDSLRTGYNLSDLFNFLIEHHDKQTTNDPFAGNKQRITKPITYESFAIPNTPCTILTDEYWYIILAMQQLAEANRPFYLMKQTKASISQFVQQAIGMFEGRTAPLQYHDLISYNNWSQMVQERGHTNGLQQVDTLFRSGFNIYKWNSLKKSALQRPQKNCWVIGKASEAKSLEFDNILIAPDLADAYKITNALTLEDKQRQLNKLYTALSRGRYKVFLPRQEARWLLETAN